MARVFSSCFNAYELYSPQVTMKVAAGAVYRHCNGHRNSPPDILSKSQGAGFHPLRRQVVIAIVIVIAFVTGTFAVAFDVHLAFAIPVAAPIACQNLSTSGLKGIKSIPGGFPWALPTNEMLCMARCYLC